LFPRDLGKTQGDRNGNGLGHSTEYRKVTVKSCDSVTLYFELPFPYFLCYSPFMLFCKHSGFKINKITRSFLLFFLLLMEVSLPAFGGPTDTRTEKPQTAATQVETLKRFELVFEPDAYYTDVDLIIGLTKSPIPQLGELTESEIYGKLLSRAALLPQFLVLEASVYPMPYLGTYIREHNERFYDNAQISGSFNWIKAVTAGFDEPYAVSLLAGNVANFYVPGNSDTKGLGYSGYLFSMGNYHIKDNVLVQDQWREYEWKMKGDRKSPVKKLSWSFRIGAKLHGNPNIADVIYFSIRRSRVDYQPEESSIFHNSGFEYTYEMDSRTFDAIRHYFFVEKKWPVKNRRMAYSLAVGFVWDSEKMYTGVLATGQGNNFQFILRPNIEF